MDDVDVIETPENVQLQRRLAGIGSRFIAGLVDNLIILGLYLLLLFLWLLFGSVDWLAGVGWETAMELWRLALLILVGFAIYWGYFAAFELLTNGQSPGKRQQRIRVVKDEGGGVTFVDVAIRNLLRPVDGFALYGVAGVSMLVTPKVQRLGDLAAGTVVVSEQRREYSARTDKKKQRLWEPQTEPVDVRPAGITLQEYRMLAGYRLRREQLTFAARNRLLPQLLEPILQRAGRTAANESFEALEAYVEDLLEKVERTLPDKPNRGQPDA